MSSWTLQSTPNRRLYGCAYGFVNGQDRYVALNDNSGFAITSTNTTTWTESGIGTNNLSRITYGSDKFVALGVTNTNSVYSTNGSSWTIGGTINTRFVSLIYGNSEFIAVGNTSFIMKSTNGISWTNTSIANTFRSIAYGNSTYVAVSNSGTGNRASTSENGTSWTTRSSAQDYQWDCVVFGNGIFVAIAIAQAVASMYSIDNGVNWTLGSTILPPNLYSLTYGRGYFVATGINSSLYSTDGNTWTSLTISSQNWFNVTYGNGIFVATSDTSTNNKFITTLGYNSTLTIPNFTVTYNDASFSIINSITTNNSKSNINYSSNNNVVANIIAGNLIIGNAGTANISLTIPSTINYTSVTANTIITVNQKQANIIVNANFYTRYANIPFQLNSTTNNPETPIQYTSGNIYVATVDSFGNITVGNIGNSTITLSQPSTTNYLSVTSNTIIYVNPAIPNLIVDSSYTSIYGNSPFFITTTTNNTDPPPYTFTYVSTNPGVANVVDGNVTVGNAGTANITITQGATTNYTAISANTIIYVNKATPTLTIPNFTKVYNDPSFSIIPNITTNNTDGPTYTYSSEYPSIANVANGIVTIGSLGNANITINQSATTNYTSISANTTITVNKATPTLTIPNFTKVYNDPSFSIIPNITTNNTEGPTYSYSSNFPSIANVVNDIVTIGNAGTANIIINQSETTNYTSISANTTITVNKVTSTLSIPNFTKVYNDPSFSIIPNISTNNTDGPTYSYSSNFPLIANIVNDIVTIGNAGIANIIINQSETTNYTSISANTIITVNKATSTLSIPNFTKVYNDTSFSIIPNITTNNTDGPTYSYSSNFPSIANVVNDIVTIGNAGTANIIINQSETTNYTYISANTTITVNKSTPTLTIPNITKVYRDPSFSIIPNISTNNTEGPIYSYSSDNQLIANVVNGIVTIGNVVNGIVSIGNSGGVANITINQSETTNYTSITANTMISVTYPLGNLTFAYTPTSDTNPRRGVAYGNGLYVAVGSGNVITTSTDGINWNSKTLYPFPNSYVFWRIVYAEVQITNKKLFVAISNNSNIIINSENGTDWNTIQLDSNVTTGVFNAITYGQVTSTGESIFIATGTTSVIKSSDGYTWTPIIHPNISLSASGWRDITYGVTTNNNQGMFIAVSSTTSNIIYSRDAINWTTTIINSTSTSTGGKLYPYFIGYGIVKSTNTSLFIIGPRSITEQFSDAFNISSDGIHWTNFTLQYRMVSMGYGDGIFIMCSDNGVFYYSLNGLDWYIYFIGGGWQIIAYGGNFVAVNAFGSGSTRTALGTYNPTGVRRFNTTIKWNSYLEIPSSFTRTYLDPSFSILPNIETDNIESPIYSYSSDNPLIANVVNGTVTLGNPGSANITINQSETTNYRFVTANTTIIVNKLPSSLTFPSSFTRNFLDPSFSILSNISTDNPEGPPFSYSYSSNNPLIANIVDGIVTIGNAGIANIVLTQLETTTYASTSANTTIIVNTIPANLGYPNASYTKNYLDASFNLNANTTNTDSTQILYSTNNSSVATVDINGNVTIGNAGTANITLTGNASTNYNSVTADISITVNKIQANLGYPNASYTKNYLDPSFNVNANTTNTDSTQILYSTNNSAVATVDINGNVVIGNAGTANITLTGDATTNYLSTTANILITVNKIQANLGYPVSNYTKNYLDPSFNVNANTTNTDSTQILYSTDNTQVATVNVTGNVTIGNAGTANITLTGNASTNYLFTTANIVINVNKIQANLGYPSSSYTKNYLDASFNVNANTTNTDSSQILYSTDNTQVATVNVTGNVVIGNAGTANITLTGNASTNYLFTTANIAITVNKIQANLGYPNASYTKNYLDPSFNLNANTTNTDSSQILYSTDNTQVATVNVTGNVTIGNAGTANITLTGNASTNYNSVTADISITVNKIQANLGYPFSSYTKNYLDASFNVNANTTNTDSTQILYSTDNSAVAIVNTTGNVVIGNAGTANITLTGNATTNYLFTTANIAITVNKIQANLGYPSSSYTKNYLDASFNVNANTTNTDSTQIVYSTDNSTVAIVNTTGNVTIGNAGTANITLTGNATTNYLFTTANILITVNKIQANLGYPSSSYTKNYLDASFNVNANTTNTDSTQILYSTDNSAVAVVNTTGNVVIGNAGTANITLTGNATTNYNSVTANILITVNKIQANLGYPSSSYTKNYLDASFNVNANTTNTDSSQILYSTDNSAVAVVNTDGNVTIGNAGTANITLTGNASTNYLFTTANIIITVNKIEANLGYPFSSYTKNYLDPMFPLNANTTNTDSSQILYSTDNTLVATVDTTGNVVIGNVGTANITLTGNASTNYLFTTANILITVNQIQANLGYLSSYTKNYLDPSFNVNANTTNTDSTQILYSTDNSSVAIVDTTGNVVIGNAGTANITLTGNATLNYFETTANILITVNKIQANLNYPAYSSITKQYLDTSFQLNANTTNTDSSQILYAIDNIDVATVDINGDVIIGNMGIANIILFGDETTNYYPITANIQLTVNSLQATLQYPNSSYTKNYLDPSFNLDATTTNTDSSQILYTTDNTLVATVNANGNVIIGNVGTANIILTGNATMNYNLVTANILITVNPIQANLVYSFSSYTKNYLDPSFPLNANTSNTDSTQILYSTDNTQVATVNANGNVTIGNVGTANILLTGNATLNYLSTTANIRITVNKIQANLGYPNASYTKNYLDPPFPLNANTSNTDSTQILYSTDNTQVAIVDTNGNVTIGNVGTANILLTGNATLNYLSTTANIRITVNKIQANLGYPNASYTKNYLDPSFSLNANTSNTDNTEILYSTDNTQVAIVDTNGNVTIGNAGTANISLTGNATTNYNSVTANILITVNRIQANLGYPNSSYTKNYLDSPFPLNANTTNTDSNQILYSTDNQNVATVNANGNVTIGNAGTANITLTGNVTTNYNLVTANILINVNPIQANLGYLFSSYTKNYLDPSFPLNANTTNTDSTRILYSTDNTLVASVDINGNVIVGNAGTANIILTGNATQNYNIVTANILITVNTIQANLGYPFSSYTKNHLDASFQLNANTTNTDSTRILYNSDNSIVANVDITGNVTIGNAGTANITLTGNATMNYKSITANILITVNKIFPNLNYTASYQKTYKDPSFNLNVNITNNTDNVQVLYSTDNSIVANVSSTGNIIVGNAGTANITLNGNETANYYPITANILINVAKLISNIQANTSISKMYNDPSFNVNASTNNDEAPIEYTSGNTYIATVFDQTGNIIIGNIGSTIITLYQPTTTNYSTNTINISLYINQLLWNLRTIPLNNWNSIAYGNGVFVAVSSFGSYSRIATSTDLINWTSPTYPYTSNNDNTWDVVRFLNNRFIVLGSSRALNSLDGITWVSKEFYYTPSSNPGWTAIAYGNELFIGITPAILVDNIYILSFDGINWQVNQNQSPGGRWRDIAYGNGVFVAVGYDAGVISTSPNGFNWTNNFFPNSWWTITYGNGLFVVISSSDTGSIIITSPDGYNWT